MPNRKRKVTQGHVQNKKPKFEDTNFSLLVIVHNLISYDAHFVIKHFNKQYTARSDDDDELEAYSDVDVTPLNGEKYLSFRVGNLRFIDSFQ